MVMSIFVYIFHSSLISADYHVYAQASRKGTVMSVGLVHFFAHMGAQSGGKCKLTKK